MNDLASGTANDVVTLRTGAQVYRGAVRSVRIAMKQLLANGRGLALIGLYEMAVDPTYTPTTDVREALESVSLLEGGELHRVTRDIVLASFGDDGSMVDAVGGDR